MDRLFQHSLSQDFIKSGSKYIQQDKHLFMEYLSRAAKLGFMPAIDEMKKIPKIKRALKPQKHICHSSDMLFKRNI
jgi:hypothetical protein